MISWSLIERSTTRDEAVALLRDELKSGSKSVQSLQATARSAGVSWRTLERAKASLSVKSVKRGFDDGGWVWQLPDEDRQVLWRSSKNQEAAVFDQSAGLSQQPGADDHEDRQTESLADLAATESSSGC